MSYKVQSGDTLSDIAQKNNTSVAEIMASNPQIKDANRIYSGQNINVASVADSGRSTYAGNFGTESGGRSQEQAVQAVGTDRAAELAKISREPTAGQRSQEIRKAGTPYVGGIGSIDQDRLADMGAGGPYRPSTQDYVVGGLLGAVNPAIGLLYQGGKYLENQEMKKVAQQLSMQDQYEPKGLFGTDFLKPQAASEYVPVYDENDKLVGSLGLDEAGQALGYAGQRLENYTGVGQSMIQPPPPPPTRDRDEPSPVSAEAVGVEDESLISDSRPASVPKVPLPSYLERPAPQQQRPMAQQPVTQPTQISSGFGQNMSMPQGEGIMSMDVMADMQKKYPFMFNEDYMKRMRQQRGMA